MIKDKSVEQDPRLRTEMESLTAMGLSPDEAFLVAAHRLGTHAPESAEPTAEPGLTRAGWVAMLGFAVIAGLGVKIPFGLALQNESSSTPFGYLVVALLALAAVLAFYLSWLRSPTVPGVVAGITVVLVAFGLSQWLYPFTSPSDTQVLGLLHVPIALAVLLGSAYLGRDWRLADRWLDYVRFLGELFIYYVLIALGGGVFMGLTVGVFELVGLSSESLVQEWVLPLGVGGAAVVAIWLVVTRQHVAENMAPVLSLVFTPLFSLLLLVFLGVLLTSGQLGDLDRNLLIVVDLVLAVVLGLHLFSVSARPPDAPSGWFDRLQLLLVVAALAIDVVVLVAMAGRIGEFGASPNKLAALGENLVLAGNLAGAAWLMAGFVRGRRPFSAVQRWQCRYLPIIGGWAGLVVLVFPLVFGFR